MGIYSSQKRFFEEAYRSGEHGWPSSEPTPFVREFLQSSFRKEHPVARILDIGCGEGRHTLPLTKEGYLAVGLDLQPLALQRAKRIAKSQGLKRGFHFLVGDVLSLPFKGKSFDVLIDYGCLHHILKRDFSRYLLNTLSILRPKGYYLLSCFSTRFRHHPKERRSRDWIIHRNHYDRFFRKKDFNNLFGKYYKILKIVEERSSENPHHFFYHVLMKKKQESL